MMRSKRSKIGPTYTRIEKSVASDNLLMLEKQETSVNNNP